MLRFTAEHKLIGIFVLSLLEAVRIGNRESFIESIQFADAVKSVYRGIWVICLIKLFALLDVRDDAHQVKIVFGKKNSEDMEGMNGYLEDILHLIYECGKDEEKLLKKAEEIFG